MYTISGSRKNLVVFTILKETKLLKMKQLIVNAKQPICHQATLQY